MIYITSKMALRIYSIKQSSHNGYSSSSQIEYKEVSLLTNSQLRSSIFHIHIPYYYFIVNKVVAMEATRIKVNSREKGLVAIMTNNGIISCYDDETRLLWKVSIYENSLINLSNMVVTNAALKFINKPTDKANHVLYAVISYSMSRKHLLKACMI